MLSMQKPKIKKGSPKQLNPKQKEKKGEGEEMKTEWGGDERSFLQ